MPRAPHRCSSGGGGGGQQVSLWSLASLTPSYFCPLVPHMGPHHGRASQTQHSGDSLYILEIHMSQISAPEAPHLSRCWEGKSGHPMISSSLPGNQGPFKILICSYFFKQAN